MKLEPTIKQFFKEIKRYVKEQHRFEGVVLIKLEYIDEFVMLSIVDVSDNKHSGLYHQWRLDETDDFVNLDILKTQISEHIINEQKRFSEMS